MHAVKKLTLQPLLHYVLYAWALMALLLSGWAGYTLLRHPAVGFDWSYHTGEVHAVDAAGPAQGKLCPGDVILTIDGVPVQQAHHVPGRQPGDAITVFVERNGQRLEYLITLAALSNEELAARLAPLVVGFGFWLAGVIVLARSIAQQEVLLFFAFCTGVTFTIAAGAVSAIEPWAGLLFGFLLWWIGPLALHLHLYFPRETPLPHHRLLLTVVTGTAALGSLLHLAGVWQTLGPIWPPLAVSDRLWLGLCLAGVIVLLVRSFLRVEGRAQAGVVVLGSGLAFTGFLGLSVLPEALLGTPVPYSLTFPLLLLIPISYSYAILRYQLLALDRYVDRSAAYFLVVVLLGTIYTVLYAVLRLLAADAAPSPLLSLVFTLVCVALAVPLYRWLKVGVEYVLYGGWYDYRTAVQQISEVLDSNLDSPELAQTLCARIRDVMRIDVVYLLIPAAGQQLVVVGADSMEQPEAPTLYLAEEDPLIQYLQVVDQPEQADTVYRALAPEPLSPAAEKLLTCSAIQLWFPLQPLGALLVGARRGSRVFSGRDREILETIARQASFVFQNTQLIAELRQRASESLQLSRQALRAREEERKRVSRELHDEVIQSLAGLNFHVAQVRGRAPDELRIEMSALRSEVQRVLGDVRRICADLRPPTLDSFGLVSALRSKVREVSQSASFQVALIVDDVREEVLSEEIALFAYRFVQEALFNAQKHAMATRITIRVVGSEDPSELRVIVEDDGVGFQPPLMLGLLVEEGHFGLVGLRERIESVGGCLTVQSVPGQGTRLEAVIPVRPRGKRDSSV